MSVHGFSTTPRQRAEPWRLDALWDVLHLRTRAAARRIVRNGTSYTAELDELMAGPGTDLYHADPTLDDGLENEVAEALADAAAAAELENASADPPTPGRRPVLHQLDLPGHPFAGLGPYYPVIEEPRAVALARQDEAIRGAIREGARIGAARRELARLRAAELLCLSDPTPAAKAALTRRLQRQVAADHGFSNGRIPVAPRLLVTGSQGTGKTRVALETLASIRHPIAVRWTAPDLTKAAEAAADYAAAAGPNNLPAIVVRGRTQPDPARFGARMCQRHEAAEQVSRHGLSVRKLMCPACPFARTGCGYLEQAARIEALNGVGVFFGAAEGLFARSPAPAADLLIGDERIDAAEVRAVPLDVLRPDLVPYRGGPELAAVMAVHGTLDALRNALAEPHQLTALRAAGIGRPELRAVIRRLEPLAEPDATGLSGDLPDAEILRRLAAVQPPPAAAALTVLRTVAAEIDQPRPMLNGLALRGGELTIGRLRKLHGIAGASVLLLDGTGNPALNRAVFGTRLRHVECRIEREAHVTGTTGRSYSRQSATGLDAFGRPMPGKETAARRLRQEVAAIAARQPGLCLIAAPKAVEEAFAADHPDAAAAVAHFGALRGRNAWEGCESAVVLGQTALSVADVEDLARGYLARDPQAFISYAEPVPADWPVQGWPFRCTRMRRMRDGSVWPVEVAIHPDPRVQAVYEQVREAECLQAADRVRPVFNRRKLVLLNSLVLDVTYDRIMPHRELAAGGTRWEQAMAATGIVPLGPADLHRMHPAIFKTESIARAWLDDPRLRGGRTQIGYHLGNPPPYRYRRKGQPGSPTRALIDPRRHSDPHAALEAVLGPLALFEALGTAPAVPPAPATPKPAVTMPPRPFRLPMPAKLSPAFAGTDTGWPCAISPGPTWVPS